LQYKNRLEYPMRGRFYLIKTNQTMSKKDKQRIAELERQQSILAANVRVLAHYFSQVLAAKEQPPFEQGSIPQSEPKQGETAKDSPTRYGVEPLFSGESILNKSIFDWLKHTKPAPNKEKQPETHPQKSALNKIVLGRIEEMEKLLANPNFGVGELSFFIDDWAKELQLDLADFRRKHLDLGSVEPSKVEVKEAVQREEKQGETDQPETEKGQVWIVQTNPKKAERLNAFYIDFVGEDGIIRHTPNPDEAMNFIDYETATIEMNKVIKNSGGRYSAADFKIIKKP
jgi:hypothetical protein